MKVPCGFLLSGISSKIKRDNSLDLGIICCSGYGSAVGFFTKNVNCSYSVRVSKSNINNKIKALLVNSGNANCFSHKNGLSDTAKICRNLAALLGVKEKSILIASTGIIGRQLPSKKIISHLPLALKKLKANPRAFAKSILTTDTFEKISFRTIKFNKKKIRILGLAKGAGMINPKMGTMLAFILTDAKIRKKDLRAVSLKAVRKSFNSINIDGCTSTNDSVYIISSGASASLYSKKEIRIFGNKLLEVCLDLAKMIVKDAEGATKFVTLCVKGALSKEKAKAAAEAIASSLLFKTALYGKSFNWGRIVAALGQANIKVDQKSFKVKFFPLKKGNMKIDVVLGQGSFDKTVYTSDITPEYVKINAGYS